MTSSALPQPRSTPARVRLRQHEGHDLAAVRSELESAVSQLRDVDRDATAQDGVTRAVAELDRALSMLDRGM